MGGVAGLFSHWCAGHRLAGHHLAATNPRRLYRGSRQDRESTSPGGVRHAGVRTAPLREVTGRQRGRVPGKNVFFRKVVLGPLRYSYPCHSTAAGGMIDLRPKSSRSCSFRFLRVGLSGDPWAAYPPSNSLGAQASVMTRGRYRQRRAGCSGSRGRSCPGRISPSLPPAADNCRDRWRARDLRLHPS